ncbi:OmpA family protein [Loktanella salsilacus]|uniref:OmpA family protein n=1 Tax=Loktanella salsilacus TaxID=195913 RepID=A0A1I4EWS0_9RHOB|nr:OmpA family protein [Loktanella salsilacus]SFL09653.1 OmpA family protein [Loktanella salsilacus]
MKSLIRHVSIPALSGLFLLALTGQALAECPPGYPEGLPCPMEPWESVGMEHLDRISRLERLSDESDAFQYFTETITAAEHGLADFPADIPVLRVVADQDAFFDTASDKIRPEADKMLNIIAASLNLEPPDVTLFVAGHTDSRGTVEDNAELGLRRAQSVATSLIQRGIKQASIYRISFGEAVPLASNDTTAGQAANRRVEFLFSARPAAIVSLLERQKVVLCAEHASDELGDCRIGITFDANRVQVTADGERKLAELEDRRERLKLNPPATEVEVEIERKAIEAEQERIPVVISVEKIEVTITSNPEKGVTERIPVKITANPELEEAE